PAGLEAHPERPKDGIDHEQAEKHQRRHDEQPAVDLIAVTESCLCHRTPRRAHAKERAPWRTAHAFGGGLCPPPWEVAIESAAAPERRLPQWRRRPKRPGRDPEAGRRSRRPPRW